MDKPADAFNFPIVIILNRWTDKQIHHWITGIRHFLTEFAQNKRHLRNKIKTTTSTNIENTDDWHLPQV